MIQSYYKYISTNMSSNTESRTVHLSNLPFEGNKADFEKYKQAIADAFKTFDY